MSRPFLAILVAWVLAVPVQAEWRVKEAPVCFTFRLSQAPTHDSAGYFVHIPDGGVLPEPRPVAHAFTSTGQPIKSYSLWQNQVSGMGVVFETPASGDSVDIYVAGSSRQNDWSPSTGITPSAILCTDPERGDLKASTALSRMGGVGPRVHYQQNPPHPSAPLCIQGDLTGRPWPASFYLLAYLELKVPGKTWIAPMTRMGQSEVHIDGKKIVPRQRIDKWGGTGQYVDLSPGLHLLEIFAAYSEKGAFIKEQGVMWMTWAPTDSSINDLGGPRPADVPHAGTSKWASRVVRANEIVRSGQCRLTEVRSRDNLPVAVVLARPTHLYWFEDEPPLFRYVLGAVTAGNPKDTSYTWSFAGNRVLTEARTPWLFPGACENTVTLTAASGGKQSRATYTFFTHSPVHTSLDNETARRAFRETCLNMVRATPPRSSPTQGWGDSMWRNLFRTLSPGEGKTLLAELFTKHWAGLKRAAPPEYLAVLEDRFILIAPSLNPEAAVQWILRFEDAARGDRKAMLQIKRAEVLMYYLNDLEAARRILRVLVGRQGEVGEWAKIRLGDVEFLAGNLNEATALYGEVQNRFKNAPGSVSAMARRALSERLARAREAAEEDKKDEPAVLEKPARRSPLPRPSPGPADRIEDWKVQAILEVSASETVRAFMDQGAYDEASEVLALWERQFPLGKISGDLVVQESEWLMTLGQHRRARRLLEAYCKEVEASSYLPTALGNLLECMLKVRAPKADVQAFCKEARERLKFHPQAEAFESRLNDTSVTEPDDGTRAPTRDTL